MTDFELLESALELYKQDNPGRDEATGPVLIKCPHSTLVSENGFTLCEDCGEIVSKEIQHEKEWRYYGQADSKHSSDPNRVQARKNEEKGIFKDVQGMGFSDKIVDEANEIYSQVTKNEIKRGNSRKAIVFACIYQAYKLNNIPQDSDRLIKVFGLTRKAGLSGLKIVTLNAPKGSKIHDVHITPVHLIDGIMNKFDALPEQKEEVISLYHEVFNRDSRLNRSRPQSFSSGLIYYWICIHKKPVTLKDFASKVGLSDLTISRVAKIIASILNNPDVI